MTDNDPKAAQAMLDGKVPMDIIPYKPLAAVARVLAAGAEKYGIRNWRREKISASTYIAAIARHTLLEYAEGVNVDADDGEHPLAHVIACCLLVMDADARGMLIDDRGKSEILGVEIREPGKVILTDGPPQHNPVFPAGPQAQEVQK